MTEQEIVNILKENKTKGIAYLFLPEEVWDWIRENFDNSNLLYLDSMGNWQYFKDADFDDYDNIVFALPDDYKVKEELNGEWVEFEIDDDGTFFINNGLIVLWCNWQHVLSDSYGKKNGYTAFGGWQYEESKTPAWFLAPQIENDNGFCDAHFADDGECKPAIPVKIRFWRENR